jgi:predicted nucleic acid-binding protein
MACKIFLDINVFVDFFDPNRPDHAAATKLFSFIENKKAIAFTSESVICTTLYLISKQYDSAAIKTLTKEILTNFEILPCSNFLFLQSLNIDFDDIEDAVIYNLAIHNKLDYFITNDNEALKKMATKKLPIVTTKDFLLLMKVQ